MNITCGLTRAELDAHQVGISQLCPALKPDGTQCNCPYSAHLSAPPPGLGVQQEADFPLLPYGQFLVWWHTSDAGFSTETTSNNGRIKLSPIQFSRLMPSFVVTSLNQWVDTFESHMHHPEQCLKKRQ
mmetsp:Transcript_26879/g.36925  ORF Transcript_26879/g.36925 Transcript_26879/m.36925 type:complete len:128 (+) Transcript_26879:1-384(+)